MVTNISTGARLKIWGMFPIKSLKEGDCMVKISQQIKTAGKAASEYRVAVRKALTTRNRLISQANEDYKKAKQTARAKYDREVKG